jgi:hypothetical protein
MKIVIALWTELENIERSRERLKGAGIDAVVTSIPEAVQHFRDLCLAPVASQPQPQPRSRTAG